MQRKPWVPKRIIPQKEVVWTYSKDHVYCKYRRTNAIYNSLEEGRLHLVGKTRLESEDRLLGLAADEGPNINTQQ